MICTSCGTNHEPRDSAGLCSAVCRRAFETACRIRAAQEYEAERVSIFMLRDCLGRHVQEPCPVVAAAE